MMIARLSERWRFSAVTGAPADQARDEIGRYTTAPRPPPERSRMQGGTRTEGIMARRGKAASRSARQRRRAGQRAATQRQPAQQGPSQAASTQAATSTSAGGMASSGAPGAVSRTSVPA